MHHAHFLSQEVGMKRLAWRTVLPAFLAIALFSGVVFLYLLPSLDRVVMDQKRLMIRELTESAWNVLARFEAEERSGRMSRKEAQTAAIEQARNLHYGQESKDYFWIIDNHPHMVVHPYRPDLEGSDLTEFGDPEGKLLFVEMVKVVQSSGSGYVNYMWQWKDDPSHIVPKLSYVKGFEPWGWILGTGVYTEDVDAEIAALKGNLQTATLLILLMVSLLMFVLLKASFGSERGRLMAAAALNVSEEKYRSLVESAGESILMAIEGEGLYANTSLLRLLGYERDEFAQLAIESIIRPTAGEILNDRRHWQAVTDAVEAPTRYEAELVCKDGRFLRVMLTLSRIVVQGRVGFMAVAAKLSVPRELDIHSVNNLDDLEAVSRRTRDLATLMMKHDADAVQVSRMLSASADGVVHKAVEFIVAELGPPPSSFDIMLMGSLGRSEVTLSADQDHAIIYPDVPEEEEARVQEYFLKMGSRLADLLDAAGYPYCQGGIMASEAEFCQSLSTWRASFEGWITSLEAEDLLRAKIFFDFRSALGEGALVEELHAHLEQTLAKHPRFFPMLAHSVLQYEPPLNSFGAFVLGEVSGGRPGFDIKGVIAQVVDVARLRALQCGVSAAGTLDRLEELVEVGRLRPQTAADTGESFRTLLDLRLHHQARRRAEQHEVDNILDPESLAPERREKLKQAFRQIKALQESLQHEFGTRQ
jgi:CBS domain-containing protein